MTMARQFTAVLALLLALVGSGCSEDDDFDFLLPRPSIGEDDDFVLPQPLINGDYDFVLPPSANGDMTLSPEEKKELSAMLGIPEDELFSPIPSAEGPLYYADSPALQPIDIPPMPAALGWLFGYDSVDVGSLGTSQKHKTKDGESNGSLIKISCGAVLVVLIGFFFN